MRCIVNYSTIILRILLFGILTISLIWTQDYVFAQESTPAAQIQEDPETPTPPPTPTPTLPPIPDQVNLLLSPSVLSIRTQPGSQSTHTVRIKNNGPDTEALQIDIAKFQADALGQSPVIMDLEPTDRFPEWLSFSEPKFTVEPGQWKSIEVTFAPPPEAALGYYFVLIFNRQQGPIQIDEGTAVSGAPAILTLANVISDHEISNLRLVEFTTDRRFYEYLPVNFNVRIHNIGNIHLAPIGNIFIDRDDTQDIAVLVVNEEVGHVLPQTQRTFTASWVDGFPRYNYKMEGNTYVLDEQGERVKSLEWDFGNANLIRIGKYTANLLMVFDDGTRDIPIEATLSFWVIPWKLILIALLVIILVLFGVFSITRRITGVFKYEAKSKPSKDPKDR